MVDLLENNLNIPIAGADSKIYEPTRLQMKQVAVACGILVPAWRFVYTLDELHTLMDELDNLHTYEENKVVVNKDPKTITCHKEKTIIHGFFLLQKWRMILQQRPHLYVFHYLSNIFQVIVVLVIQKIPKCGMLKT